MTGISDALEFDGRLWCIPMPPPIIEHGRIQKPYPEIATYHHPEFSGCLFIDGYQCVWCADDGFLAIKSIHGSFELPDGYVEHAVWVSGTYRAIEGSPFEPCTEADRGIVYMDFDVQNGLIIKITERLIPWER